MPLSSTKILTNGKDLNIMDKVKITFRGKDVEIPKADEAWFKDKIKEDAVIAKAKEDAKKDNK